MKLMASDVYKELRLRGYDYGKTFQGILESNQAGEAGRSLSALPESRSCRGQENKRRRPSPGDEGKLQWTGNWVTFLDTMLQMLVVGLSGRSLRLPTRIRSVCVDPVVHLQKVRVYADDTQGTLASPPPRPFLSRPPGSPTLVPSPPPCSRGRPRRPLP